MGRVMSAALLVLTVCVAIGCGRQAAHKQDNTVVSPSVTTPAQPAKPAAPSAAAVSSEHAAAPSAAKPPKTAAEPEPGPSPIKPAVPYKSAASRDVWQQMRDARKSVRSYKSTTDEGDRKTTQYIKLADGKPVIVKVREVTGAWVLADLRKNLTYVFDPGSKSISRSSSSNSGGLVDDIDSMRKDGGAVSSGSLNGKDCWVVKVGGQFPATYWVDKKLGILRQIADSVGTRAVLLEDINRVPEKEFQVPAGVPIKTP